MGSIDDVTGQILNEEDDENNVTPLRRRPVRPGVRRTTVSGSLSSSSDDAKTALSHARIVEVEGASDRLGLGSLRDTLDSSEAARRGLTQDLVSLRTSYETEVERVRAEYESAADATEGRHAREALRWREDRDNLRREVERLEREAKDQRKAKKKHKKTAAAMEIKLEELRQAGSSRLATIGLVASGVPPIAQKLAEHIPDIFMLVRKAMGGVVSTMPPAGNDDLVKERAAAIRFAGRLFEPQNQDVLDDLKALAYDVVDENGKTTVVSEWDLVNGFLWSLLRNTATAAEPKPEVVESPSETTDAS